MRAAAISTVLAVLVISVAMAGDSQQKQTNLSPPLRSYLGTRTKEFDQIPAERKTQLKTLALYVQKRIQVSQPARLTFICTHNSRRSHISQIWAVAAARYYGVDSVEAFSGGTEATAFNPRAVAALRRAGLNIAKIEGGDNIKDAKNARYEVRFLDAGDPLICYSKVYDEVPNPKQDFCAVMCCSQADMNCPTVKGSSLRVALPYEDPKVADNLPEEAMTYDARCQEICREMAYLFSQVEH
jgi:arsenate reductase